MANIINVSGNEGTVEIHVAVISTLWINITAYCSYGIKQQIDIDSHTNTTVMGKDLLIIQYYDWLVRLTIYDPSYESNMLPTIKWAVAYGHSYTGQV